MGMQPRVAARTARLGLPSPRHEAAGVLPLVARGRVVDGCLIAQTSVRERRDGSHVSIVRGSGECVG